MQVESLLSRLWTVAGAGASKPVLVAQVLKSVGPAQRLAMEPRLRLRKETMGVGTCDCQIRVGACRLPTGTT